MDGASRISVQRSAFEQVFYFHEKLLLNWLTKILGDHDSARDVAQNTFLNIWRLAQTSAVDSPKALIFRTAGNLAANELRRRRRFNRRVESHDELEEKEELEPRDAFASPEFLVALRQEASAILKVIDRLPQKPRRAFKLNRFKGLNYLEIAAAMNVSESSVEKYMMEALRTLREERS